MRHRAWSRRRDQVSPSRRPFSYLADGRPAASRGRAFHRLADRLHVRALVEIRRPRLVRPVGEQVDRLIGEARAIADALADRPPLRSVRVTRMLGTDPLKSISGRVVATVAEPQF